MELREHLGCGWHRRCRVGENHWAGVLVPAEGFTPSYAFHFHQSCPKDTKCFLVLFPKGITTVSKDQTPTSCRRQGAQRIPAERLLATILPAMTSLCCPLIWWVRCPSPSGRAVPLLFACSLFWPKHPGMCQCAAGAQSIFGIKDKGNTRSLLTTNLYLKCQVLSLTARDPAHARQ